MIYNVIIIGSGPAGLTAGIYTGRANLNPLIIEGPKPGGQLTTTTAVENWPGEKSIMGPKLMQNIKDHAKHAGASFLSENIVSVDFKANPFILRTHRDQVLKAHSVIIASGATPKRLGIPGEEEYWGRGVTTCAVCDGAFFKDQPVVIIGGGDSAMEDASFMSNYTNDITIVQIEDKLSASFAMQQRVLNKPFINILYNSTAIEIHGDGQKIESVTIQNKKTGKTQSIKTSAVFLAIGLKPNTAPFKGQVEMNDYGYLIVKNHTQTSIPGVFGAGDVQDYRYRQAITSAGAGCMAALDAERYLHSIQK